MRNKVIVILSIAVMLIATKSGTAANSTQNHHQTPVSLSDHQSWADVPPTPQQAETAPASLLSSETRIEDLNGDGLKELSRPVQRRPSYSLGDWALDILLWGAIILLGFVIFVYIPIYCWHAIRRKNKRFKMPKTVSIQTDKQRRISMVANRVGISLALLIPSLWWLARTATNHSYSEEKEITHLIMFILIPLSYTAARLAGWIINGSQELSQPAMSPAPESATCHLSTQLNGAFVTESAAGQDVTSQAPLSNAWTRYWEFHSASFWPSAAVGWSVVQLIWRCEPAIHENILFSILSGCIVGGLAMGLFGFLYSRKWPILVRHIVAWAIAIAVFVTALDT